MRFIVAVIICLFAAVPNIAAAVDGATQLAIIEYDRENYEEALDLLLKAQAAGSCDAQCVYYMGLSQKQTGDYPAAAENLAKALQGPQPQTEAVVELIAVLTGLDRPDEALKWVQWAENKQIKPEEIAYQKGLILAQKKRYAEARKAFAAAKTGNPENDQQVDFQMAVALAQEGKTKAAREDLKAIVTRYPGTDVATFAQEYEQRISTGLSAKRWNLFAGVNYLYDDNVTLKSSVAGASSDTRNEKNSGVSESLRFEYDAPINAAWSANFQYSLQNNNYTRLYEYDMLSHGLTVNAIYRADNLITSLPFNITHTTLNYRNYSLQESIKPTATIIVTPENLVQLSTGYTRRDMSQPVASPLDNRTANIFSGQAGYIKLFSQGQGMLNLRGEVFYEDAHGSEWSNLGRRLGGDLLVPVAVGTRLILTAESVWQDYEENTTGREDNIITASATVNQKLYHKLYLNLQYLYSRAFSSNALYDYQRNVFSSGIELRF